MHFRLGLIAMLAGGLVALVRAETAAAPLAVRGVWLDKGEIVEGREKLAARLDRWKDAGFNTVYVATQIRGAVIYPDSRILPQYKPVAESDPEILAWLIDAARQRGLRTEAWMEFGFYAYWTPDASKDSSRGVILDAHPELAAIDRDGKSLIHNPQWGDFFALCPANPKAQDVLIELYLEAMQRYAFDGLQLDRIRFPEERFCHCPWCREHFEKDTKLRLRDAAEHPEHRAALDRWRKAQTAAFVERFSKAFRERFPKRRLTAAVVPPYMIDGKGQDWPVWVEKGWVDAVAVMLYAAEIAEPLGEIRARLGADAPVYIGVDAAGGAKRLTRQIRQVQERGFPGVVIWYSKSVDPLLSELRWAAEESY
jgi:uncharacterized lipoprotein YddW (UPF0748 family)